MDPNTFPTKGNLILAKNSLKLSRQGYELMDKKRNILIREMMELIQYGDWYRLCPADRVYGSCRELYTH